MVAKNEALCLIAGYIFATVHRPEYVCSSSIIIIVRIFKQKDCLTASSLSDYVDYAKIHNAKIHNSSEHCNFSISRGILFNHFSQKRCTRFLRSYSLFQAVSYMVSYLMLQRRKRGKPQLFYRLVYSALFIEHQPVRVEVVLMGVQQVYVAEIVAVP